MIPKAAHNTASDRLGEAALELTAVGVGVAEVGVTVGLPELARLFRTSWLS